MSIILELPNDVVVGDVEKAGGSVSEQRVTAADVGTEVAKALKEAERLSPEEQSLVDNFAKQINLRDTTMVLHYGTNAQKKLGDFSSMALESITGRDVGEVSELLVQVSAEINGFNQSVEKSPLRLFYGAERKAEMLRIKYAEVAKTLERIAKKLEGQYTSLQVDVDMLDRMYDQNLEHYRELTMYILAGKQKLAETRAGELLELRCQAKTSRTQEDELAFSDLEARCNDFEKQLHDLELTRMICLQTAPQIRLVQRTNAELARKIQSTITNTLPLWQNKVTIGLALERQSQAAEAQKHATDLTNEMLQDNAERLHASVVAATRESERGAIDIKTVEAGNRELMATISEVLAVQKEGRKKRREAEVRLQQAENELKKALMSKKISSKAEVRNIKN